MACIENVQVFGLDETIFRSSYPMLHTAPTPDEFNKEVAQIVNARMSSNLENPHIKRAIKLANAKGGGHDQFLSGITVTFDMTLSNKAWVEAERYSFLTFISSMSTMHRVAFFKIGECCNAHTSKETIQVAEELQAVYNNIDCTADPGKKKDAYLDLLYNLPSGFELMAGMITNYRCLRNIYEQRRNHRLPDWHIVCDWIETLPMANELIVQRLRARG